MSPAAVDFLSPGSASQKLQTSNLGSQNSSKSRIQAFPSVPLFNLHGASGPLPTMDRLNLGNGVSPHPAASFPPPPFHSASKTAALDRRHSRPRLVKHRKHSSNCQARPAATMHDDSGSRGFNPFQTEVPVVVLDRQDHSGAESVQDQLVSNGYGYPRCGTEPVFVAGSTSSNPALSKNGKAVNKGFGFSRCKKGSGTRSDMDKAPSLGHNLSEKSSTQFLYSAEFSKFGGAELDSGDGSLSDSNATSIETGMSVGDSIHSTSTDNAFVFGSSTGKAVNLRHHSSVGCDDGSFSKLNLHKSFDGSYRNMNSNNFAFNNEEKQLAHSSKNENSFSDDFVCSEKPDKCNEADYLNSNKQYREKADLGTRAFRSFAKTNDDSNWSSFVWSDDNLFSNLPEKLCKLGLETSGNDEHANADPCAFWVGDGVKRSANAGVSMPFGSVDGSFSNLDETMKKHNLWNSADKDHKDADFTNFACRSSVNEAAWISQSCLGVDEGAFSKLHKERKVLQTSCQKNENNMDGVFVFGSGVKESTDSTKSSSHSLDLNSSAFVFSGNKDTKPSSIYKVDHKLKEEIEELEVDGRMAFQNQSNVTADFKSAGSVHISGLNYRASSSQASEMASPITCNSIPINVQNEKRTCSAESFSSNVSLNKMKDPVPSQEVIDSLPASLVTDVSGSFAAILQSGKHDHGASIPRFCADGSGGTETELFSSPLQRFHSSGADFVFASMHAGLEPRMEFRCQKHDTSSLTKKSLCRCKNMTFTAKKGDSNILLKKKRGKYRKPTQKHSGVAEQFHSVDKDLESNLEHGATDNNLPMDYSPFQETLAPKPSIREASVSSDVSIHLDSSYVPNDSQRSVIVDGKEQELVSPLEFFDANDCLPENEDEAVLHGLRSLSASNYTCEPCLADEKNSELSKDCLAADEGNGGCGIETCTSARESESFSFGEENAIDSNFVFTTRSLIRDHLLARKRGYQRRSRVKDGEGTHSSTKIPLPSLASNSFLFQGSPRPDGPAQVLNCSADDQGTGEVDKAKANQEFTLQEACEKWRLRGNKAYRNGDLFKAEDYYSRGVNTFPMEQVSENCSRALLLCYSNRAAARMSLGRPIAALEDCKIAIEIDPSFLRAHVRAGNIHLSLGEPAAAQQHFSKCLELDRDARPDSKISSEAVDGLEKAKKLSGLLDQTSVLLAKRTSCDATKCLKIISEALSISPYSESLLEMKAEALLMLQDYEGAIEICELTLELAEKNAVATESNCFSKDSNYSISTARSDVRLWRWRIISRSYFHLGNLEEACELIQKHEKVKPFIDTYAQIRCVSRSAESYAPFPFTVRELLRLKAAGNKAFQAGRHLEAVEHYTAAVTLSIDSRPFTAICFCNRAAAYQALGKIADAIADCSLAIALNHSYKKAISRKATLLVMIRDYEQSASDLRKLVSLLENSSNDRNAGGAEGISIGSTNELNQARTRLSIVENEARKGYPLDIYMILGIDKSSSEVDVRKAYRKAALRHHPDKACQFLAHIENGDYGIWKEVADEVYTNADRLFKMVAEAYAILSNPSKRMQYDAEEESRTTKDFVERSSPRTPPSSHGFQKQRNVDPFGGYSYRGRAWV